MKQGKKADQQNITAANIHMLHVHTDCCTNKMTSKVKKSFFKKKIIRISRENFRSCLVVQKNVMKPLKH